MSGRRGLLVTLLVGSLTGLSAVTHGDARAVAIWTLTAVAITAALGFINFDVAIRNLYRATSLAIHRKRLNRWRLVVSETDTNQIPAKVLIKVEAPYRTVKQRQLGNDPAARADVTLRLTSGGITYAPRPDQWRGQGLMGTWQTVFPDSFRAETGDTPPPLLGSHEVVCAVQWSSHPPPTDLSRVITVTERGLTYLRSERRRQRRDRVIRAAYLLFWNPQTRR